LNEKKFIIYLNLLICSSSITSSVRFFLLLLLFQILHSNWLLAHWAGVVLLEPALDALGVKEVSMIARQLNSHITGSVLFHAYSTLCSFFVLVRIEFTFHYVFHQIPTGWNPVSIGTAGPPH
jgi:hypothetical protein